MVGKALEEAKEARIDTMQGVTGENSQHNGSSDDETEDRVADTDDCSGNENCIANSTSGTVKCKIPEDQSGKEGSSSVSSSKCSGFEEARCNEVMTSSESNKENQDNNSRPLSSVDFDSTELNSVTTLSEYEKSDLIPLPQLLKMHGKQLVSGFEFGEATKRRAQENMKSARDKKLNENRRSSDLSKELDDASEAEKPCCSKEISEREHKTPHSHKRQRLAESKVSAVPDVEFSKASRRIPDSILDKPDCIEVWVYMIYKEEASLKLRNPRLFNDFKSVTPRMRAILLDWLMEVAAVYHLRRVTYYLSVDYFDRFLSIRPDIPKSLLQLVGITCLYIAAKVEEIYPPNLSEFVYVCDGACKSKEMVSCELLILNSLGWEVVLTTPSDWLNLYMQLHFKSKEIVRANLSMDFNKDFIFPQFSAYQFTRASQLMDLLSLDPGFLKFGYSVIAAGAMYYMYGEKIALSVSGLSWAQLQPCVDYMDVFHTIIKGAPDPRLHSCLGGPHPDEMNKPSGGLLNRMKNKPENENYSFQTHVASMDYFEKATIYRLSHYSQQKLEGSEDDAGSESDKHVKSECDDVADSSVGDDLPSLDELAKHDDDSELEVSHEQNLMSLDEIFELIINQDELRTDSQ